MNILSFIISELKSAYKTVGLLALVCMLALFSTKLGPMPHITYIQFPFMLLCLIMAFRKGWSSNSAALLLLLYLPLNILVAQPSPVFQSWNRLLLFAVVFVCGGPLLQGQLLADNRKRLLAAFIYISVIVTLLSFVCYFLGINYMSNQSTGEAIEDYGDGGSFGGLTMQSITLGFFSGVSCVYCIYRALKDHDNNSKYWWVFTIVSFGCLFFAASRTALLATVAACVFIFFKLSKRNTKTLNTILVVLILALLTLPLWEHVMDAVFAKQASNDSQFGLMGSRELKWTSRMQEFFEKPLFGWGFASINPNGLDYYDSVKGVVEPGTSWLAVLSMTGLVGMLLFGSIYYKGYKMCTQQDSTYSILLGGLMVYLALHLMAEGYIFAGGNAMCFWAWLIIACSYDLKYIKE